MSASRRTFLKQAGGSAVTGLMVGLPNGWAGTAYAQDGPETATVRFGIIALTDCAPIVMAHELGYFKQFGIQSVVSKEASWAVIRDKLSIGDNQATHMLIGMPLASTMGLAGSPVKPMVIPWLLNRNGQAITLNNKLKAAGVKTPKDLKPLVDKAKASGEPLSFAMTFPPGTHAMWMRYWLASGGIHPDKDVSLITIPPAQMVANMKVDKMDGFCVGEPWNNRAIADGIGFTAITTQQMWRDHPEKVCAFTEEFALKNPKTVKAVLKALHLASVYLDKMENRPSAAEVIARPAYINCPPEIILQRLLGNYEYGDGRKEQDKYYMIYSDRECNYPQRAFGMWWLSQFRRWGMVKEAPDYQGVVKRVMRPDIYLEAMKEMGVTAKIADVQKFSFWDGGTFDAADPEKYREVLRDSQHVMRARTRQLGYFLLPSVGVVLVGLLWQAASQIVPDLPSPVRTWEESKLYLLEPFAKRGEIDQGIARLAYYSLVRVSKGFLIGIAIATPLGLLLGVSKGLHRMFDPVMQILRPISPLAWLPLGLIVFRKSEPAALFAIAVCSMWPTVINGAAGVRAIPQDYWNVAKVLRLSRFTTFTKIVIPATLPYLFTGYRLSLGIAWLVIVASEMLTGTPGVGGFLWQEYNSLIYAHILLAIVTIGVIGFALDRLMGAAEARLRAAA